MRYQALIAARLATAFPDVPLVAEEDAAELRSVGGGRLPGLVVDVVRRFAPGMNAGGVLDSIDRGRGVPGERYWTLDPVDGTRGFLRGGRSAVALALIQDGAVMTGILGCPHLSLRGRSISREGAEAHDPGLAVAVRGRGAWWVIPRAREITRLSVSGLTNPSQARVLHSVETAHSDVAQLESLLCALGSNVTPLLLDSQAKHVVLAARRADLLLRFPTDPSAHDAVWDHAAGALLVSEAGGRVSDLAGRPLDFSAGRRLVRNSGLLASNGWLHDAALRAIEVSRASSELANSG